MSYYIFKHACNLYMLRTGHWSIFHTWFPIFHWVTSVDLTRVLWNILRGDPGNNCAPAWRVCRGNKLIKSFSSPWNLIKDCKNCCHQFPSYQISWSFSNMFMVIYNLEILLKVWFDNTIFVSLLNILCFLF